MLLPQVYLEPAILNSDLFQQLNSKRKHQWDSRRQRN